MMPFCHLTSAFCLGSFVAPSVFAVACMTVGGVLPDRLDALQARKYDRESFFAHHRRWSHNPCWWLLGMILCFQGMQMHTAGFFMPLSFFFYLCAGALCHTALDALNPSGIPLVPFRNTPRLRLSLVRTGSWLDYLMGAVFLAIGTLAACNRLHVFQRELPQVFSLPALRFF